MTYRVKNTCTPYRIVSCFRRRVVSSRTESGRQTIYPPPVPVAVQFDATGNVRIHGPPSQNERCRFFPPDGRLRSVGRSRAKKLKIKTKKTKQNNDKKRINESSCDRPECGSAKGPIHGQS